MINTQYINLNMIPSGVMPVLYCSQYDIGRPLGVVVYNGSESVDLSGYTCTIEATRTDKTPVIAAVITSGNIGVFETTATMTNQADTYKGKLVLTDGNGKRVASLAFVLVVTVRTMDEDAEEIEEDASIYQQYTGTVQTIIASIRADLAAEASTRAAAVSAEAAARQSADNTLQSNLNAEASTRVSADALLQSEIDEIIAPSGEAPSAAEVENARIGSDGTVYPTLGDAIRTQNSLLKNQINSKCSTYKNVLNLDAWFAGASGITVNGYGVVRGTGNSFKAVTAYSPSVKENTQYTLSFKYYCEQNVSSESLAGIDIEVTYTDTTTDSITLLENQGTYSNTQSIVTDLNKTVSTISFVMRNHRSNYYVIKELMLEEGATLTEYVPYLVPNDSKARDAIAPLEKDVTNLENAVGTKMTELIGGYTDNYWNDQTSTAVLTSIASGYVAYNPIEVTPGKKYRIKAYQGTSSKQDTLLFVNNDYGILAKYGTRQSNYFEQDVTAPENAKYALITVGTRTSSYLDNTSFKQYDLNDVSEIAGEVSAMESVMQMLSLNGKTVAIIGDSISTNGDLTAQNPLGNVPEILIEDEDVGVELSAYATYYDIGVTVGGHEIVAADVGTEITFTPVAGDVGKMVGKPLSYNTASKIVWWEVLQEALEFNPIPVCWSGASVSSHEGSENEYKTSYAWHDAQIRKCGIRTPGTMTRIAPDVIIIYRGTNDFSHSPYAKLTAGYFEPYNWEYPVTDELASGYGYKEALCLTIKKLRNTYPNARIILCTLNVFKRVNYSHFPTNNGAASLPQYNDAIREVADFMGCGLIEFDKDGITFENCYSEGYITDSETTPTHPSNKGHKVMANRALADLAKAYNNMT